MKELFQYLKKQRFYKQLKFGNIHVSTKKKQETANFVVNISAIANCKFKMFSFKVFTVCLYTNAMSY